MPDMSSDTPATTASSRVPCDVVTRSATSGAKRLCIARGVLSSFNFHNSFMLPTLAGVNTFSSRTQPVRALSNPSVRKSTAPTVAVDMKRTTSPTLALRMSLSPFVVSREMNHMHPVHKPQDGHRQPPWHTSAANIGYD